MSRRDVRRILSDLAGVDPEQDAGIEVQLHARTPGPRGTHTVTTVRMVDLTHALADLVERQSKEAVHRAQERAHRAESKVTELQLAAVRKEREMSETTERGETVSLHDRLREAESQDTNGSLNSYQDITERQLAAIEAAIREDATAPLRKRLDRSQAVLADRIRFTFKQDAKIAKMEQDYTALKARADALYEAANRLEVSSSLPMGGETTKRHRREVLEALIAFDAADRAGETQDTGACPKCNGRGRVPRVNYQPGYEDKDMDCPQCGGTGESAPVPPDINWHGEFGMVTDRDGKTSSWVKSDTHPHLNYDTRESAPNPTDAAAGEDAPYDPELAIDGLFPYIEDFDERIRKLEDARADLERWREGVDEKLFQDNDFIVQHEARLDTHLHWHKKAKRRIRKLRKRVKFIDRAMAEFYNGMKGKVANLSDRVIDLEQQVASMRTVLNHIPTLNEKTDKRLDALEARQGGVPEVTDDMIDAGVDAYRDRRDRGWPERSVVTATIAAALAVMGTGGGR